MTLAEGSCAWTRALIIPILVRSISCWFSGWGDSSLTFSDSVDSDLPMLNFCRRYEVMVVLLQGESFSLSLEATNTQNIGNSSTTRTQQLLICKYKCTKLNYVPNLQVQLLVAWCPLAPAFGPL